MRTSRSIGLAMLGLAWSTGLSSALAQTPLPPPPPSASLRPNAYPLRVSADRRYLVDRNGAPFLLVGDSPQALIANLSEREADTFFADREAHGFNAVWINLLCATYTGGRADGSTFDGIVPFTTPDDLLAPNPAYFARVDDMLHLAAKHGLVVVLDPAETGSYLNVLLANGVVKSHDYGRFLGARYRDFDNIIWMSGNDFQSWQNPGDDAVVRAVARGIRSEDHRHIHTAELDYPVSGTLDDPTWAPLIELNASYTYYPTYAQVLADYDRPDAPPTFMVEANYEFEHNAGDLGTPQILRRQEYWTMLSGAAGQLYGNGFTWPFRSGWKANLDTPGSAQIAHLIALLSPRPPLPPRQWWNLIPDQNHKVVVGGNGTFCSTGSLGASDYLTAARTPDGALVLAYMPTLRTITVDMTKLGGPADASWYDPSNGVSHPIAGSPFPNSGLRILTPPGVNADGDGDWVLVLEAPSVPPDTQPPSSPTGLSASGVTDTQAILSWTASTDDVAVAAYRLFRDGVLVHTTRFDTVRDDGLSPSTSYTYTVEALDFADNVSAPSVPLVVTTAAPQPEFVQQNYATPQTPQSQVAATYSHAQSAGDTNLLAIGWNDTTASIQSVVDSAGNAYQAAVSTFRGNGLSQAIWFAPNIVAAAAGTNQVTVTFDRAAVFVDLRITEYARLRTTTNPFDAGTSSSGSGSLATTGFISAPAASELLFAAGMTSATFTGPGSSYTSEVITNPDGDIVEDAIAPTTGSYRATAPLNSGTWLLQIAAFRAQ